MGALLTFSKWKMSLYIFQYLVFWEILFQEWKLLIWLSILLKLYRMWRKCKPFAFHRKLFRMDVLCIHTISQTESRHSKQLKQRVDKCRHLSISRNPITSMSIDTLIVYYSETIQNVKKFDYQKSLQVGCSTISQTIKKTSKLL